MQFAALTLVFEFLLLPLLVAGQLSGRVGPVTTIAQKRARQVCDVTRFGAVANVASDLGPALTRAFIACKTGGLIVIPPGQYGLATWVTLQGGTGWALQWDGIIYRTGSATPPGNMIMIVGASDIEVFSSTGKGAFQGTGYRTGKTTGPRILRIVRTRDFSVHDLAFVDSPSFHFTLDTCTNGEVYNMAIRGRNLGGLDGIDIWAENTWVHDVMVTNGDECVTVKSPSSHILIENIYCNRSGGSALGSLGAGTAISDVVYRNVYTVGSTEMMLIKSNGGSGFVRNVLIENFIGHSNAYSLDIDQQWLNMRTLPGPGVQLSNIIFKNWKGTAANGALRGPIRINCAASAPCTDIKILDFSMWTDAGNSLVNTCANAYGVGQCIRAGAGGAYPATKTIISARPADFMAPTMPWDLPNTFGSTSLIPIPEIPASFFPGRPPIKPLARR
ncbi:Glycoside hydrolase family 28 [Venturia nashicola]|uniref:Glycoside hydrolase family 28 n=1 Tax=Venturia nashicola TaxID=86259 RepID=A0A4Z1P7R5_9PEZI|nr:Glycoside hydrolase family 28 [Venturia nashicola]